MTIENIAKIVYSAELAFCQENNLDQRLYFHGGWDAIGVDKREQYMTSVDFITNSEEDTQIEEIHDHWVSNRLEKGWKFGPIYDEVELLHPNLVHYDQLPRVEKVKLSMSIHIINILKFLID